MSADAAPLASIAAFICAAVVEEDPALVRTLMVTARPVTLITAALPDDGPNTSSTVGGVPPPTCSNLKLLSAPSMVVTRKFGSSLSRGGVNTAPGSEGGLPPGVNTTHGAPGEELDGVNTMEGAEGIAYLRT